MHSRDRATLAGKGPLYETGRACLRALALAWCLGQPLTAGAAPVVASGATGPTLRVDCAQGPSEANPVADFMYFIPLISPEPVAATADRTASHHLRLLPATRRRLGQRFQVSCEFELTGNGSERNAFDYGCEVRRREAKLKRDGVLPHVLAAINIDGPGRGLIEIDGTQTNGAWTVAEVRLRFNARGRPSPVTIAMLDITYRGGAIEPAQETIARVNTLTFQKKPGPPKMEVTLASIKPKNAGDSYWQDLKGSIKGLAANLLLPPLNVDARGHQAMLDFGLALAAGDGTFTFPRAANLLPPGVTLTPSLTLDPPSPNPTTPTAGH